MSWTDNTLARLREYLEAGYSASQIATQLNNEFDIRLSRNAVIGKYKRLGLNPAPRSLRETVRAKALEDRKRASGFRSRKSSVSPPTKDDGRLQAPDQSVSVLPSETAPGARMLGLLDLRSGQCRYPHDEKGEDGFTIFCAADAAPESSYCPAHRRLCISGTFSQQKMTIPGEPRTPEQEKRSERGRLMMLTRIQRIRASGQQKAFS